MIISAQTGYWPGDLYLPKQSTDRVNDKSSGNADTAFGEGTAVSAADQLLARLVEGDEVACAEVIEKFYTRTYRVAWRVMGGPADAEDIAQEAFVKLWQNPGAVRDGRALGAWLARVASNLAIDRLRRKKPVLMDELPEIADDGEQTDTNLRRKQMTETVDRAIAQLPDRQKTALVMTYYEGFDNRETAEAMEISVEAVESLLARARRNLKSGLAEQWQEMLEELNEI